MLYILWLIGALLTRHNNYFTGVKFFGIFRIFTFKLRHPFFHWREIESLRMRTLLIFFLAMSMSGRKRNGAPDAKYYDANETVAKFDNVRQWLLKNCKKVRSCFCKSPSRGIILINAHPSTPSPSLLTTSTCLP